MSKDVSFEYSFSMNNYECPSPMGARMYYEMSVLTIGDDRHMEIFNPTLIVGHGPSTIFEVPIETLLKDWIKDEIAEYTIPAEYRHERSLHDRRVQARTAPVKFDNLANRLLYGLTIDHIVSLFDQLKAYANSLRYDDPSAPEPVMHSSLGGAAYASDIHAQIIADGHPKAAQAFFDSLPDKPASDAPAAAWKQYDADCERIARAYAEIVRWRWAHRQAVKQAREREPLQ